MSMQSQIFQTSSPSRWKKVKWSFRILLFTAIFFIVVVALAIINGKNPSLPNTLDKSQFYQTKLNPSEKLTFTTAQNKKYKGFKDLLEKRKQENNITASSFSASLIRAAFYTPWSITSLPDLKKNAGKLNTIYPEWFFIDPVTFTLQNRMDSAGLAVMKQSKLSIQPIFNNFHSFKTKDGRDSGYFDAEVNALWEHTLLQVFSVKAKHQLGEVDVSGTMDFIDYYNTDFEE